MDAHVPFPRHGRVAARLHGPTGRVLALAGMLAAAVAGCGGGEGPAAGEDTAASAAAAAARDPDGQVTISGDDRLAGRLTWRLPAVERDSDDERGLVAAADAALADGNLYRGGDSAIPLYLAALAAVEADDAAAAEAEGEAAGEDGAAAGAAPDVDADRARAGLAKAVAAVLAEGDRALALADDDAGALRAARVAAAVVRTAAPDAPEAEAYLARVDMADTLWELGSRAERALAEDAVDEDGGAALALAREALVLVPGNPRARQVEAAVESALLRRAEQAGTDGDFSAAARWLEAAGAVRDDAATIVDARARILQMRLSRIGRLRDEGLALLARGGSVDAARGLLAQLLALAEPGNPAATELRERIDLAVHYGMFRPRQVFTDALDSGARGPQMVVVPHGGFRMGAADDDARAGASERPQRYVRFDRGFALSLHEVTVAEFGRFIAATGHRTRADRRGYSMAYDERSGNFIRRSGVDWRSDYAGATADGTAPVLHISAVDAEAYAGWLSQESAQRYRLPSEAEFEYALRAGGDAVYPWGPGEPPAGSGNVTGARDRSPGGRNWSNAFPGFGDSHWGPAPVGTFSPNAFGVHDLAGNVSEWVADCWHDSYRRAPTGGTAWVNPGCRTQVIRGGSWASAPSQTRSSWRAPAPADTTNARIGFRVARDL